MSDMELSDTLPLDFRRNASLVGSHYFFDALGDDTYPDAEAEQVSLFSLFLFFFCWFLFF